MLGRTREAAGELAKIAGDRGSAAQQCERSYHALIAMAPINSRALSETGQSLGRSESQQFFAVNSCGR
ncbi:hypothetical protein [Burkholderia dolosa]|uniref:hypothetical protein n=1 Tax=Burkholderia dolosa TaxID=152500 RepID=UPI003D15F8E4